MKGQESTYYPITFISFVNCVPVRFLLKKYFNGYKKSLKSTALEE